MISSVSSVIQPWSTFLSLILADSRVRPDLNFVPWGYLEICPILRKYLFYGAYLLPTLMQCFLFFFFFYFPVVLRFFSFFFQFFFFFLRSERLPYRWWYSLLPTPLLLLSYSPLLDLASRRLLGWCHVRPVPWEPEVLKYWILGPVWPKLLFPPIVSCDEKNGLFECFKCGREILLYDYECCV